MEEKITKHRQMMEFCHSHLTHNIFNHCMRRFFFGLVYVLKWLFSFSVLLAWIDATCTQPFFEKASDRCASLGASVTSYSELQAVFNQGIDI